MKTILFLVAMLIAGNASAQTVLYSKPGETMDQFVMRIARPAMQESVRLNREVCGHIENAGGLMRLELNSGDTNSHCVIYQDDVLATFHTHLPYMLGRFSPRDYSRPGYMVRGEKVCRQEGAVGTESLVTAYGRRGGKQCRVSSR